MNNMGYQQLTLGQTTIIELGSAYASVVIDNESQYYLNVQIGTSGGNSIAISAWVKDLVNVSDYSRSGYDGRLIVIPQNISDAQNAPSAVIGVTAFLPGENIPGTYPVSLNRQLNVGNGSLPVTTVTNLINTGNPDGTLIIQASSAGSPTDEVDLTNDGYLFVAKTGFNVQGDLSTLNDYQGLSAVSYFFGIGPGVVAHRLGTTPDSVQLTGNDSTIGAVVGYNYTPTTVTVNCALGQHWSGTAFCFRSVP